MPKDMRLLRDLWRYIAPDHAIAKVSDENLESLRLANLHDEALKQRARKNAFARYRDLQRLNQPIPRQLAHFCQNLRLARDGKTYERPCKYRVLTRD
jgi:hypothetical protein